MTTHITRKDLGQYFTVSDQLQQFVFDHVQNKSETLLEPSFGAGHLLKPFKESDTNYPMVCCEIDSTIVPIVSFNEHQTVIYGDFTKQRFSRQFRTIIGNPPYVKQRTGNLYIRFIETCYNLLDEEGGELIFIVPSDFIKLTSAAGIIDKMTQTGSFTHFLFPNNERLFTEASIDVVVFRYQRGLHQDHTIVNGERVFCNVNRGIITFSKSHQRGIAIQEVFNVYVGMVSGRDAVYRVPIGNVEIRCDQDTVDRFIYTDIFPTDNQEINDHLLAHKAELLDRQIRKFTETNWFQWGAPRNVASILRYWGEPCIYVKTLTRKREVAFLGRVEYFGGSLLCLVPKEDPVDLQRYVDYMNTDEFQRDYTYAGRFKIGHKQLSTVIVSQD